MAITFMLFSASVIMAQADEYGDENEAQSMEEAFLEDYFYASWRYRYGHTEQDHRHLSYLC